MPIVPEFVTTKCVAEDEPIANSGELPFAEIGLTENCAHGVEEPTPRKPALVMVVVPVAPNCARFAESIELDALPLNCCKPVQVFACARLSVAVSVSPSEAGEPPIVSVEFASVSAIVEFWSIPFVTPKFAMCSVPDTPPTSAPIVPEYENSEPSVADVVATEPSVAGVPAVEVQ